MTRPVPIATVLTLGFGLCYIATGLWVAGLFIIAWWQQHRKQTQ